MLVVISILGVLAMVVSLSMVGITKLAQRRADDGERLTVQSAMDMMMMDQHIDPSTACAGSSPTNNMGLFPNGADDSRSGTDRPVSLYPRYLHKQYLDRAYVCTTGGGVQPFSG